LKARDLVEILASDETSKELERIAKRVENLVDEGKGLHPKYLVSALGIALGDGLKMLAII
jgi:hypothetical protein